MSKFIFALIVGVSISLFWGAPIPGSESLLAPLLCEQGETLHLSSHTKSTSSDAMFGTQGTCESKVGVSRVVDVSKLMAFLVALHTLPLWLLLKISRAGSAKSRGAAVSSPIVKISSEKIEVPQHMQQLIVDLLKSGNKIEAIKKIREITHMGLKESKDMAELWEKNGGAVVQVLQSSGIGSSVLSASGDPAERLKSLQKMRDEGVITQEEFDKKRQEIIQSV